MKTILQVNASILSNEGQSTRLANDFVARFRNGEQLILRDLARDPVPHLTGERFVAFTTAKEKRTSEQDQVVAYSDQLIGELKQADVIVLGLPMYNFGVPSSLKAYVFAARGGIYVGTPRDTQSAYVRDFLAFLGITDVEFVYAEGLAIGDAQRQAALAGARSRIEDLIEVPVLG